MEFSAVWQEIDSAGEPRARGHGGEEEGYVSSSASLIFSVQLPPSRSTKPLVSLPTFDFLLGAVYWVEFIGK